MNKRPFPSECKSLPKIRKVDLHLDDCTPVRTFKVTNIGDNICTVYLRGYFEGFVGPVSDVWIDKKSQNNRRNRVAYVTFQMFHDAARLTCDPELKLSCKFTIDEAEKAFQPKLYPSTLIFEELNDDCLRHIAFYLDFIDIVNLGRSSKRLQAFAQLIYQKRTYFDYPYDSYFSNPNQDTETVLQEIGPYIESVSWYGLESSHFDLLSKYCPNVTEMTVESVRGVLKSNDNFCKKIKHLEIVYATFNSDDSLKALITSDLTFLHLDFCDNICGKLFLEWTNSKLKDLKITCCRDVDSDAVFDFVLRHKLEKFSYDGCASLYKCLSLQLECLSLLKEIELDYFKLSRYKLDTLNFKHLKQLTHLSLTYQDPKKNRHQYRYENCNELLVAASQIPSLTSLTVEQIRIDCETLNCLGMFKNLKTIRLHFYKNKIGERLFTQLHLHVPEITKIVFLELETWPVNVDYDVNRSICEMITALPALKYFAKCSITDELLNMILQVQLRLKRPTIELGILDGLFPAEKAVLVAKGAITVSRYDEYEYE